MNEIKTCSNCNQEKQITEFYKCSHRKCFFAECKKCNNKRNKKYKSKNKTKIEKQRQEYRDSKFGKGVANNYYIKNKDKIRNFYKEKRKNKKYRKRLSNKACEYSKKRKKKDIHYRNLLLFRTSLRNELKEFKHKKKNKSLDYLGCDMIFFCNHLESQFQSEMNWSNQGKYGWHIDHILPCELFDLSKEEQIFVCFNYKNLKPQWRITNIEKSDFLPDGRRARDLISQEKLEYLKSLGYNL